MRLATACLVLTLSGCHSLWPGKSLSTLAPTPPLGHTPAKALLPTHDREWSPDLATLPRVEWSGDRAIVRNIRDCVYESDDDYVISYYDKQFDLSKIQTVDFIVVPFKEAPSLAHTMLSFGFEGGDYVTVSAEARLEKHEKYNPLAGALRQYELMYVVAAERDAILRRTRHRGVDVYLYRTVATPEQARSLFADIMERVNRLGENPEFYDTLRNNCTTNIVTHLNSLRPGRVPLDLRILLPGFSDGLAYELGLIDTTLPFAETQRRARVTDLANRNADASDFSTQIRR
ncbi:MAG: hypothetical protein CMJ64_06005 [Planctomycetaceae bacterium]|nr:hypothetical protein [Planctomycetaceae bacterium]